MQHGFAARIRFYDGQGSPEAGYKNRHPKRCSDALRQAYLAVFGEEATTRTEHRFTARLGELWHNRAHHDQVVRRAGWAATARSRPRWSLRAEYDIDPSSIARVEVAVRRCHLQHGWWQPERPADSDQAPR